MGFNTFLQNTMLPEWFPLANMEIGRQQVLGTLGMKKDGNGALVWDQSNKAEAVLPPTVKSEPLLPMESRSRYKVIIVGGGIAGLSCCLELFNICERDGVEVEVCLVEGRSRLGGRLWTDRETFNAKDSGVERKFPVDLGASWIHGIESNPLAAMALEAKVDFVGTSEEVTMLRENLETIDHLKDERAGELFDKLLDIAVENCWRGEDGAQERAAGRPAVRWYAEALRDGLDSLQYSEVAQPKRVPAGPHRDSTDTSVDEAIGNAISSGRLSDIASISEEERRMLSWNIKNVEYALGANIADLSIMYWDADDRYAFEGDHVVLKQGYSCVVDHLFKKLKERGDRFTFLLESPVKKLEYARKTKCNPYFCPNQRHKRFVELSDKCRVECENGTIIVGDFVVCAVPLGVLKESIQPQNDGPPALQFVPDLPFSKKDSINSVGFGLLDKVFLQFPTPFWRTSRVFNKDGQTLFGNASAVNPHHYMFLDVGLTMGEKGNSPPILMTLISGKEAVAAECLSEKELVAEVMRTLKALFGGHIPEPSSHKATQWGRDRFSRGSYTYLPPGTSDQDFRLLQSPINGNGDAVLLDGSETMRLFFAGEHTTALHPSMAHGAMLSGYRAAKEIADSMVVSSADTTIDQIIPLSLFRHMNPKAKLTCALCHLTGPRVREGSLLAFKRGSREVVVHINCAENCPEVGIRDGVWSNVIRACNRGKVMECSLCGQIGATIGCTEESCTQSFHFSCAEDTGWRFDDDGKDLLCDIHRPSIIQNRKISLEFWLMKAGSGQSLSCNLCGISTGLEAGELLAFQKGTRQSVLHECCARYTTVVSITEKSSSRFDKDFDNIFEAVDNSRTCGRCSRDGATIECAEAGCRECFHFHCARSLDWDFSKSKAFRCIAHRKSKHTDQNGNGKNGEVFQHALFSHLAAEPTQDIPANLETGPQPMEKDDGPLIDATTPTKPTQADLFRSEKLSEYEGDAVDLRLVNIIRGSLTEKWNLTMDASLDKTSGSRLLTIAGEDPSEVADGLYSGDVVCTMNGIRVGSPSLDSIEKALNILRQEVEVLMEVCSGPSQDDAWG